MNKGFTLIELLVVICIVMVIAALLIPAFGGCSVTSEPFTATVTNKWQDLDYDNGVHYRIQTDSGNGETATWNGYYVYSKVHVGGKYKFKATSVFLTEATQTE